LIAGPGHISSHRGRASAPASYAKQFGVEAPSWPPKGWDTKYADISSYAQAKKDHKIVEINWWQFLTGEGPCTPLDGLRDGDVLRIFNAFMSPSRFKLLDLSVEQFLVKRWEEVNINSAMRHYGACRQRALTEIQAIELLGRETLI
jgi:hypothetical protein